MDKREDQAMSQLLARPYWFLRHGETEWNARHLSQGRTDIPLNDTGLAQAQAAGKVLAALFAQGERPFSYIVSSPLVRAFATAEHVQKAVREGAGVDLPVYRDTDLQEVCFGVQEGKPMGDWYNPWIEGQFVPEGGERFDELRQRAVQGVNRAHEQEEGTPLIVAHGALFRALRDAMGLEVNVRLANATPVMATPQDEGWALSHIV